MKQVVHLYRSLFVIGLMQCCALFEVNGQALTGTLQDKDGNIYIIKTMPDSKQWMTTNLNVQIPESYCYENSVQKCKEYGRLYTWKSAQEGCKVLGDGWRLPTNDDWQQMARQYGGVFGDSRDSGKLAYTALLYAGKAEFNALLGGGRGPGDDSYARINAHGFYWTATENDTSTAYFYNFAKGSGKLFIQTDGEKNRAFSVRCIKDAGSLKKQ